MGAKLLTRSDRCNLRRDVERYYKLPSHKGGMPLKYSTMDETLRRALDVMTSLYCEGPSEPTVTNAVALAFALDEAPVRFLKVFGLTYVDENGKVQSIDPPTPGQYRLLSTFLTQGLASASRKRRLAAAKS